MTNKVFINSAGQIEIQVAGNQTATSVRQMGEATHRYCRQLRQAGRPVLILDNLKHLGTTTPEARQEVAQLARTLDYDRAAMVGDTSAMMRHGTNLMLRAIGRPNVRYFVSRDAAEIWLDAFLAK